MRWAGGRTYELLGEAGDALQDGPLQRLQLAPLVAVRQAALHRQECLQLLHRRSRQLLLS